ncbi:cation:proton antiporter [Candidatus Woesearchaeota archaeon]|nr:cation:proton antiporter [Candidatus Woesearchaeota archaeon]
MALETFVQISFVVIISVLVCSIIRFLKQPMIIGYIVSGIVVGSQLLQVVDSSSALLPFSQLGIALLLFTVGLNLNLHVIRQVGKVAMVTGIGQFLITGGLGYAIAQLLGFETVPSLYIAVALTFSSTIIIMKLLSDKGELETLHGRITTGFLLVQDVIAIIILIALSATMGNAGASAGSSAGIHGVTAILIGLGLMLLLFIMSLYILPRLTRAVARSQEFLLLASLGWCFLISAIFYSLNLTFQVGALLAGVALATSPYRYEISAKLKPIRDFFVFLFFIMLGTQMTFSNISSYVPSIIILSVFVLIATPPIIMALMGLLGYTKRNSFLVGLAGAQISEFSFILAGLGVAIGHLLPDIQSLITVIGLITIGGSTYFIQYSDRLYQACSRYLAIFERSGKKVDEQAYHDDDHYEVLLFGYNRIGYDLLHSLKKLRKKVLVVDFNPDIITMLSKQGVDCRYGDADDLELLQELHLPTVQMTVSTIPDISTNLLLLRRIRECNKTAVLITVSHHIDDAMKLYEAGATYVVMPHFLGGKHTSTLIERYGIDLQKFLKEKVEHIHYLKKRKDMGHNHPVYEKG